MNTNIRFEPNPAADKPRTPMPEVTSALSTVCLLNLLDELDVGVLVCEASGHLVHANAAGWQALRESGVLTLEPGTHVGTAQASDRPVLEQALLAAVRGRRQLFELRRGDRRLMVAAQLLNSHPRAPRRALLLLGRRSMAPDLVVEMLCRLHALTAAEQRVLSGLLEGECVESLAQLHGVKVSTVRTQVAALRAKLGVKRIVDAMRLASELPPMASALRRSSPHSTGVLGWAAD
jgi:DNA-binding CsgD family transcriptional regulator